MDFENDFWPLVESHGRVAHLYKSECEDLWSTFSPEQQQAIYDAIKQKLATGRFVSFRPTDAIRDNAPKAPKVRVITAEEYYRIFHTQANKNGWVRTFLPEEHRTIYVKSN